MRKFEKKNSSKLTSNKIVKNFFWPSQNICSLCNWVFTRLIFFKNQYEIWRNMLFQPRYSKWRILLQKLFPSLCRLSSISIIFVIKTVQKNKNENALLCVHAQPTNFYKKLLKVALSQKIFSLLKKCAKSLSSTFLQY